MKVMRVFARCSLYGWVLLINAWAQDSCPALNIPPIIHGTNIFSDQQLVYLGDAIDASLRMDVVTTEDPAVTAHMQSMVDRMALALPAPRPTFHVALVEIPTANAYSTVAGHIYVGRKLVAQARSEDELAGVLAHEMGHLVAKHLAIEISDGFQSVLAIKQVGDQKDVIDKWNEFLSNQRRVRASDSEVHRADKARQAQADTIGLYLMSRAGYSPQASVDFFDRIAETKGKTGGFWSDFFGETSQDSKRLREMVSRATPMPAACVNADTGTKVDFVAWKNSVVEYVPTKKQEDIPGLISKRTLAQRLIPTIDEIHISPDGHFVLAQDESGVYVLSRLPLKYLFHVDAWNAAPAMFTPDSQSIVFSIGKSGGSPRVERWDIASQKRVEVHEIHVAKGCVTQQLSPDGKSLACVTANMTPMAITMGLGPQLDLDLYDTSTGKSYWHEVTSVPTPVGNVRVSHDHGTTWEAGTVEDLLHWRLSALSFSSDSRYLMVSSDSQKLCFDLSKRTTISLPRSIKGLMEYANFTFVGSDRFIGEFDMYKAKARLVKFPSGDVLADDIPIGAAGIVPVARGNFVLLRPLKNNPVGVLDLTRKELVLAGRRSAMDIYDDSYVSEQSDGSLQTFELATAKAGERVQLPPVTLGQLTAGSASSDLNWFAMSQKTRGGLWDLQTGHQLYKVMGFQGAYFDPQGALYADFYKLPNSKRTIGEMTFPGQKFEQKQAIDDKVRAYQYGRYLLEYAPSKDSHWWDWDVTMEVHDVRDMKLLWSKHFAEQPPEGWVTPDTHTLVLYWAAGSKAIKSLAKQDSDAAAKLGPYRDKEGVVFVQAFDLDTGKVTAQTVIDTARNSFVAKGVSVYGSRLALLDDQNRIMLYTLDGKRQATFPGRAYHVASDLLLVEEESQEEKLALYDLNTFQRRTQYVFESPVIMTRFSGDGKRLLVVTADQSTYLIDPLASSTTTKVASN